MLFFFQAEDGIRARDVTGVQTCALPIYVKDSGIHGKGLFACCDIEKDETIGIIKFNPTDEEIGRASCRERV